MKLSKPLGQTVDNPGTYSNLALTEMSDTPECEYCADTKEVAIDDGDSLYFKPCFQCTFKDTSGATDSDNR